MQINAYLKMVFFLISADIIPVDGLKYVAVSGEQSSEVLWRLFFVSINTCTAHYLSLDFILSAGWWKVEIWDLNAGERLLRLPPNSEGDCPNISTKDRGWVSFCLLQPSLSIYYIGLF